MPLLLPRILCALALLTLAGCYSSYGHPTYNPYGPGVPTYSPQAVPQFGPPVGSPTPVYPNGTFPGGSFAPSGGSTFPSDNLTPTPDPNSSFPSTNSGDGFSPSNGFNSSPPSGGTGLVPRYGDPETLPPARSGNTFDSNTTPFSSDGAAFQPQPAASQPVGMRYEPTRSDSRLQLAAHQASSASNPYGYDATGYRWLKGLVDYDEEQRAWLLIYDTTPDSQDIYRGQITLFGSSLLAQLQNNEFVMVEGRVDNSVRDAGTGKPQYRVETLRGI